MGCNETKSKIFLPKLICHFEPGNERQQNYCLKLRDNFNHPRSIRYVIYSMDQVTFSIKLQLKEKLQPRIIQSTFDDSDEAMEDALEKMYQLIDEQENKKNSDGPIDDEILKQLKIFKFDNKNCKKDKDGKYENPTCCICLKEITKGQETVLIPCEHMFHWKCCLIWLEKSYSCPMCRFKIG